jgi:hypothetical protein
VWEPVIATDVAPPLTRVLGLVDDRRAIQYWDPERALSADIVRSVDRDPARYGFDEALPADFVVWDVVAVFSKSARWEGDMPAPAYHGGPVVDVIAAAREAIAAELAREGSAGSRIPGLEGSQWPKSR